MKRVYSQSILPVLIYGCETRTVSKFVKRKLENLKIGTEISVLCFTRKDSQTTVDTICHEGERRHQQSFNIEMAVGYLLNIQMRKVLSIMLSVESVIRTVFEWRPRGVLSDVHNKDFQKIVDVNCQNTAENRCTCKTVLNRAMMSKLIYQKYVAESVAIKRSLYFWIHIFWLRYYLRVYSVSMTASVAK